MSLDYDDVNIFFTHLNPTIAAEFCCDAHVRKMVVESTQMLANAYHMESAKYPPPPKADGTPYAKSHWNHPCAVWVREDFKHWDWLRVHAYGLAAEFKYRFGGDHACLGALNYMTQNIPISWVLQKHFMAPPLAIPPEHRPNPFRGAHAQLSPIAAYRHYIRKAKQHLHTWTKRNPPLWLIDDERRLSNAANALIDACRLTCWDADDYRAALAPSLSEDQWGNVKELADAIANGYEEEPDSPEHADLASDLFDKASLALLDTEPNKDVAVRAIGRDLTAAEWQMIKWLATERANARDPLARPANWDFSNYRG